MVQRLTGTSGAETGQAAMQQAVAGAAAQITQITGAVEIIIVQTLHLAAAAADATEIITSAELSAMDTLLDLMTATETVL